eukprot:NODE_16321_length_1000_cov_10.224513.p1 GENE.NODE_16321_length_1000_cov_10.224513~~NODE_16321_length_1000_cov_10.224513.p1  ORF type:complete len:315 (-),score=65.76 NODE_16321_length_1000_cov_10.224513:56-871(-)
MAGVRRSKTVWCVRHGQAEHNVLFAQSRGREAIELRDPALTALGREQAQRARGDPLIQKALGEAGAQLIVASPMRRALQTALEVCSDDGGRTVLVHPDLQECHAVPCDTGSTLDVLRDEFPSRVDFSQLLEQPESWFEKPALVEGKRLLPEGVNALRLRVARFTAWLAARPEEHIVIVAHHTLFAHLIEVEMFNCEVVEMALRPGQHEAALWSWRVIRGSDPIVPLFKANSERLTNVGSPPLSGTLATSARQCGQVATRVSAEKAGLPVPA